MRVQPGQHAVDAVFDQFPVIGGLDIVGANALYHVPEFLQELVHLRVAGFLRDGLTEDTRRGGNGAAGHEGGTEHQGGAKAPLAKIHVCVPL